VPKTAREAASAQVGDATPYCTAAELLAYQDRDQVGYLLAATPDGCGAKWTAWDRRPDRQEMKAKLERVGLVRVRPDRPRPSHLAMVDPDNPAGAKLLQFGRAVTAEIDGACLVGGVYGPDDLRSLTGASRERLRRLAANLWFLRLVEQVASGPVAARKVPGATRALRELEMLKNGEALFGTPGGVTRVGNTVVIAGQELELSLQLAILLELALKSGGLPFDDARRRLGLEDEIDSGIRARVSKLNKELRRETRNAHFTIHITTRGKRVSATIAPKHEATKKLPTR
jgi:hypothetical protein